LPEKVEDFIANIAAIFHWPCTEINGFSLADLVMWEGKARARSGERPES